MHVTYVSHHVAYNHTCVESYDLVAYVAGRRTPTPSLCLWDPYKGEILGIFPGLEKRKRPRNLSVASFVGKFLFRFRLFYHHTDCEPVKGHADGGKIAFLKTGCLFVTSHPHELSRYSIVEVAGLLFS